MMRKKRYTPKKIKRIEATTRCFQGISRILYICLAIAFGLLITATALPQKRKHDKLLADLEKVKQLEEAAITEKEYKSLELYALREDPEFLEVQARDRLNYYREGERVLRFDPHR